MNEWAELVRAAAGRDSAQTESDADLLARYADRGDRTAFELLVWRHGGMVRGVCRRVLRDPNDVDDAAQATFLALARQAGRVRAVGPWLARVAGRAARILRRNAARAARTGGDVPDRPAPPPPPADDGWRAVLADEIDRLPRAYREVVRRCYLDGRSAAAVGAELGWPRGTVLTRLAWARLRLRRGLTRRGVTLGAGGVAALLHELAAGPVTRAAVRATLSALSGPAGPRVASLTDGVLATMIWDKVRVAATLLVAGTAGATVLAAGLGAGGQDAAAPPPPAGAAKAAAVQKAGAEKKAVAGKEGEPDGRVPGNPKLRRFVWPDVPRQIKLKPGEKLVIEEKFDDPDIIGYKASGNYSGGSSGGGVSSGGFSSGGGFSSSGGAAGGGFPGPGGLPPMPELPPLPQFPQFQPPALPQLPQLPAGKAGPGAPLTGRLTGSAEGVKFEFDATHRGKGLATWTVLSNTSPRERERRIEFVVE